MFNFHIPRAQQCQQLAVSCRLVLAHLSNCRWTAVPEVSEQGRNKLAVQLLAVTRARSPSTRVACEPHNPACNEVLPGPQEVGRERRHHWRSPSISLALPALTERKLSSRRSG